MKISYPKKITNTETANAFLLGLLYNQQQSASRAWEAPYILKNRIGHLIPEKIASISQNDFEKIFSASPAIHPFTQTMSLHTIGCAYILSEKYQSDARNIWKNDVTVSQLLKRLEEFPGIGKHKAFVGIYMLALHMGVPITNDYGHFSIRDYCPRLYDKYGADNPFL